MRDRQINIGIGFATGRKSFQSVLNAYVYQLEESGLVRDKNIHFNLLVAYDLAYAGTKLADYTGISEMVKRHFDNCFFIGADDIAAEAKALVEAGVILPEEEPLCFGGGYASKRNSIVYTALKNHIDYLIFLDDDEYPMAVTQSGDYLLWSGQHVLESHIKYLQSADITNGYHCGYISPIPYMEFDNIVSEGDFRTFIEALSNDILNWDTARQVMLDGGITYADKQVLIEQMPSSVEEVHGAKFITGGNLGLNLRNPERVFPFYNPPGARGEDTFLSTCLSDVNVKSIPTYTFHDGFSIYSTLLKGVLPNSLRKIYATSEEVVERFYRACIGWVRYKPLYTYITRREEYGQVINDMREKLSEVQPKVCSFFNRPEFSDILHELDTYDAKVKEHYADFERSKELWEKMKAYLASL